MRALSWRGKIWSFEYVGDILLQLSGGELGPGHALRVRGWGKHDSWCLMFALLRSGSSRRFSPSKLRYSSISSYSSSTSHASASAGALYTWGNGSGGSLGYDMSNSQVGEVQRTPQKVLLADGSSPPWTQVACGNSVTLAVTSMGEVYSWGSCEYFSLGLGKGVKSTVLPTPVTALSGIPIVKVATGEYHSAARSAEGDLYTWGWGGSFLFGCGGLGHGDKATQPQPALVEYFANDGIKIVDVSCGQRHTLALSSTGMVYSWGNGEFGRCGNGLSEQLVPKPVEVLSSVPCAQVSAGQLYSAAVTQDGDVYVWGKNDQAQLGLGGNLAMDINTMEAYPVKLDSKYFSDKVKSVATGRSHMLALTKDGNVYYWGSRNFLEPHFLLDFVEHKRAKIISIAAGENTCAAIGNDGALYTWGKNFMNGGLGHGERRGEKQPKLVQALAGKFVTNVSLMRHSAAITQEKLA